MVLVDLLLVKMLYMEDVLKDVAKVGGGEPG